MKILKFKILLRAKKCWDSKEKRLEIIKLSITLNKIKKKKFYRLIVSWFLIILYLNLPSLTKLLLPFHTHLWNDGMVKNVGCCLHVPSTHCPTSKKHACLWLTAVAITEWRIFHLQGGNSFAKTVKNKLQEKKTRHKRKLELKSSTPCRLPFIDADRFTLADLELLLLLPTDEDYYFFFFF